MFHYLKNLYDFIKEIEHVKIQEPKNIIKHNSILNKNEISEIEKEVITTENKKVYETTFSNREQINNDDINESIENEKFTFLFSSIGKELLIDNNIIQKQNLLKNDVDIKLEDNNFIILNKNKYIYSVVIRNNKLSKNYKLSYIYSLYEYYKQNYPNNLNYYVQVNFIKKRCKILKISILNLNKEIWNFEFSKINIKNKLENLNSSNCLCYILFYNLLLKEYKLYISDIIKKLKKKKKGSFFFIIKKEEITDSKEYKKEQGEHIYENKKSDIIISKEHKYDTVFFKKIFVIFNLLREENTVFLKFYNLENYTRIFIYNCENLNRNNFIYFLKNFEHFHIYLINLNTLFGLYFSETEKNILKVFKKCKRILINSRKNVCVVIDGIDIIAKNISKEKEECLDECNEKHDNNNSSRILTTLLLCLDSIDNCTLKKKSIREKELQQSKKSVEESEKDIEKKKKLTSKKTFLPFSDEDNYDDDDKSSNESEGSVIHSLNNTRKKKKLSEQITYDIKKLGKIFKEKYIQSMKRKTKNNLSVIVLSDLTLECFDISLTRAGRFFHYLKYS